MKKPALTTRDGEEEHGEGETSTSSFTETSALSYTLYYPIICFLPPGRKLKKKKRRKALTSCAQSEEPCFRGKVRPKASPASDSSIPTRPSGLASPE